MAAPTVDEAMEYARQNDQAAKTARANGNGRHARILKHTANLWRKYAALIVVAKR